MARKLGDKARTRAEFLIEQVEQHRDVLAEGGNPLPSAENVRAAIEGILNSRTGRELRAKPKFGSAPYASLLFSAIEWHRGNGGGVASQMIARMDASSLPGDAWDEMHTVALVLLAGKSRGADFWRRALGTEAVR